MQQVEKEVVTTTPSVFYHQKYARITSAHKACAVSRSTLYSWMTNSESFPQPIRIQSIVMFDMPKIEAWLKNISEDDSEITTPSAFHHQKLGRIVDVYKACDVSRSTVYKWMAESKTFPQPMRVNKNMIFDMAAIEAWLLSNGGAAQ